MAKMGRPKAALVLTEAERAELFRLSRRAKSAQALALRCRIVLACAEGKTNTRVAAEIGVSQPTVGKWRSRYVEHRLDGLTDEARPGPPPSDLDEPVEEGLVAELEAEQPPKAAHLWRRAAGT